MERKTVQKIVIFKEGEKVSIKGTIKLDMIVLLVNNNIIVKTIQNIVNNLDNEDILKHGIVSATVSSYTSSIKEALSNSTIEDNVEYIIENNDDSIKIYKKYENGNTEDVLLSEAINILLMVEVANVKEKDDKSVAEEFIDKVAKIGLNMIKLMFFGNENNREINDKEK
jgi:hypothetical protein